MLKIALTVVLLVVAARAEFPFTDSPLQPSFHSNKVFFNITDLTEIAGVWNGVSTAIQQFVFEVAAEFGTPFNLTCDGWRSSGWNYDYFDLYPHAITIDVDQNHLTDGLVGNYVEADTDLVTGVTRRFGIRDYSVADGL